MLLLLFLGEGVRGGQKGLEEKPTAFFELNTMEARTGGQST